MMKIRVSLKAVFVALSILCLIMWPISVEFKRAERKLRAIDALRENHGYVTFSHEVDGSNSIWRSLLGETFWADTKTIAFYSAKVLDGTSSGNFEDMRVPLAPDTIEDLLTEFPECKELLLTDTTVTCADLEYLKNLNQLKILSLQRTLVDDSCLATLAELKNLKTLYIDQTKITGEAAMKLHELLPNTKIWHEVFQMSTDL